MKLFQNDFCIINYSDSLEELIDNELNKRVKDYSKNKYELEKYCNVGNYFWKLVNIMEKE